MIFKDPVNKKVTIFNKKVEVELSYNDGFYISSFIHKSLCPYRNKNDPENELFVLDIEGLKYPASCFEVSEAHEAEDKNQEMVSWMLTKKNSGLLSRVCLINNPDDTMNLIVQLAVQWDEYPKEVYLHIPFLADFSLGCSGEEEYYFPANPRAKVDGNGIMQLHDEFRLPLGIFEKSSGKGFGIEFPVVSGGMVSIWDQNRNHDLCRINSREVLKNHSLLLRPGQTLTDIFEMKFTAVDKGWPECFSLWRKAVRKNFALEQYERDDLKWYRDTFLHHFTFIYGKEAYNYETDEVEISRLIRQGEDFGGYDAVLLWHQYPRLGVDSRNQWDFFSDFPGGKACIRKIVDKAHSQGVKAFLPFKPWDIGSGELPDNVTNQMAQLIKETDVDGIFFDTMNSVPEGFREAIDKIKPGVAFCTEIQPQNRHTIELITGSWDQYGNSIPMPETNLLRYVLPEHFSPIIARWHVGIKKDMLIKRAIFNGTGIVIWQDIFGSWLPYSKEQKDNIKKWKGILKDNKDIYFGSNPIPMYPTLQKGLSCNYFLSDDGDSIIYSIYNETDERISGDLLMHGMSGMINTAELWRGAAVERKGMDDDVIICSSIDSKDILIIKITR